MASRTPEGKHVTRFIIMVKSYGGGEYCRSGNYGLSGFFLTREEAQAALDPQKGLASEGVTYKVRQK